MPDSTPEYDFTLPFGFESMAAFDTHINPNWDKISATPAHTLVTTAALPQVGNFEIGDTVYHRPTTSVYVLVVKDADYGWHWRPIQAAISPWINVPSSAILAAGWTVNPASIGADTADPWAIAYDNQGNCFWRGKVGLTNQTSEIPQNTYVEFAKPLPDGLSPKTYSEFTLGHREYGLSGATGLDSWEGVYMYFQPNSPNGPRIRREGGTSFNPPYAHTFWFNAKVAYTAGSNPF